MIHPYLKLLYEVYNTMNQHCQKKKSFPLIDSSKAF